MDSTSSSDIAIFTIQSKTKNQLHVEKGFMDEILCKKLTSLDKKRRSKRKRINKRDSRSSGETFETTVTNTSTTTLTNTYTTTPRRTLVFHLAMKIGFNEASGMTNRLPDCCRQGGGGAYCDTRSGGGKQLGPFLPGKLGWRGGMAVPPGSPSSLARRGPMDPKGLGCRQAPAVRESASGDAVCRLRSGREHAGDGGDRQVSQTR